MERLIELVRGHPILYDKNHPDYMKTSLKDEIWARLAVELDYRDEPDVAWECCRVGGDHVVCSWAGNTGVGLNCVSGMEIKEQWRKLRECHREALRRQYNKRRRNHGMYTAKMWMYQKQMEFLLPFMAQRGPDTTLLQESPEEEYCHQFKMEDSSEDQPSTSETIVPELSISPASHQSLTSRPRYKRKLRQEEPEAVTIPEPVYERQSQRSEDMESRSQMMGDAANDSLYQFFMCMFNTTKNLPVPMQLRLKKKIFDVVVEAEEEMMETSMELGVHHLV